MFFHFLDEFMSFVCFLSSVDCNYFICGDFNIHVDVPCTDTREFKIPIHVMTCTPKLQVQVYIPVEGLFS